ncbi:hypothetical protein M2132_001794 [Dysgonomonas sp. PH5-45]|uniref:hypothetical protein n=1 Tax=unclassified Dysgonomonas TaxID=2630389 RepID=UPI002476F5B5|nr:MULTISPECIES: hypothetical protein [unclassified Dysgonomonas]MDH6355451.1 hypothetical protein [Dysgonomonas sp. PH5-45]MDH6388348.1 hypothetical protein [Dysgonomonas sp. PH5-37]
MIPQTPIQNGLFQKFGNYKAFFNHFKPGNLLVLYEDIDTVEDSLRQERFTLQDIDVLYSTEQFHAGIEYIMEWLEFINIYSNISKPLKDTQLVAFQIYKKHKLLYLTDLKVIFEKMMDGDYGPFYGSIDSTRIHSSFKDYSASRNLAQAKIKGLLQDEMRAKLEKLFDDTKGKMLRKYKEKYGDSPIVKDPRELAREVEEATKEKAAAIRREFFEIHGIR